MFSEESLKLRAELKQWEITFLATNGRKPGRGDIKQNSEIAAKYKAYNKLRDPASTKATTSGKKNDVFSDQPRTPSKKIDRNSGKTEIKDSFNDDPFQSTEMQESISQRGCELMNSVHSTRSTGSNNAPMTPTNVRHTPLQHPGYDSPLSLRHLRSRKDRDTIGPTPQKAGKVLGIFESAIIPGTPPKTASDNFGQKIQKPFGIGGSPLKRSHETESYSSQSLETPKKRKCDKGESGSVRSAQGQSSFTRSKELGQSSPITPRHPKQSPAKDLYATPSFLRRSTSQIFSDIQGSPPTPVPRAFKPAMRALSSLMAELRKMQDETMDQEEDILREMEMGNPSAGNAKPAMAPATTGLDSNKDSIKDPLPTISSENVLEDMRREELEDKDGNMQQSGQKIWKKKGLKRQTRRVKMRPVRNKPCRLVAEHNDTQNQSENAEASDHESGVQEATPQRRTRRKPGTELVGRTDQIEEENSVEDACIDMGNDYDSDEYFDGPDRLNENKENDDHNKQTTDTEPKATRKLKPNSKAQAKSPGETLLGKPKKSKHSNEKKSSVADSTSITSKKPSTAHVNFRKLKIRSAGGGRGRKGKYFKRRR